MKTVFEDFKQLLPDIIDNLNYQQALKKSGVIPYLKPEQREQCKWQISYLELRIQFLKQQQSCTKVQKDKQRIEEQNTRYQKQKKCWKCQLTSYAMAQAIFFSIILTIIITIGSNWNKRPLEGQQSEKLFLFIIGVVGLLALAGWAKFRSVHIQQVH